LLEQPEDNLYKRTVYNTLTEFIKNKKIDRQIIMVSHNSNLVVSTDSENIIVANQNGQKEGTVKFDYINGALENSFKNTSQHISVLESQGIREHVCEILEGGEIAFKKREKKYNLK
jgi:predicted ATP-dependent endonuclease of OLD family